jgi:hypothetical protein
MKPLLLLLALVTPGFAQQFDVRQQIPGEDLWMLDVVLSDARQADAFNKDMAAASAPGADKAAVTMRWRKKIAEFAQKHKAYLDNTDIVPNAESVQKMVSPYEFAVTSYWLNRQPRSKQEEVRAQVEKGNSWLLLARGKVEASVRDGRKEASARLGTYLAAPPVREAVAYREPAPVQVVHKPKPPEKALETAEKIVQNDQKTGGSPESVKDNTDKAYTGGDNKPQDAVVDAGNPADWKPFTPNLTLQPSAGGSFEPPFQVTAPPSPVIDQNEKPKQQKNMWSLARLFGPPILMGVIGGILFGALLGPVGAVLGAIFGAGVGYNIGKDLA